MNTIQAPHVQSLILSVTSDLVQKRKPFTAFDVTRIIRSDYGVRARHDNLKTVVHSLYDNGQFGNYTRTLIQIPGVSVDPNLYHDPGSDPDDYINSIVNPKQKIAKQSLAGAITSPVPSKSVVTPSKTVVSSKTAMPNLTVNGFTLDKRNRLGIPAVFVRALGANPGDVLYATPSAGCISITNFNQGSATTFEYVVDKSNNIRISHRLISSSFPNGKKFDIEYIEYIRGNGIITVVER